MSVGRFSEDSVLITVELPLADKNLPETHTIKTGVHPWKHRVTAPKSFLLVWKE